MVDFMSRCTARWWRTAGALLACGLLAACATAPAGWGSPEVAGGSPSQVAWRGRQQAVAAAHPLAAEAGAQVLREGGNALDAAIAAQMVLALVEPQSSGLGGGAFLLWWDGARVRAFDGRETAPAAASPGLFLQADGRALPMAEAIDSGRSVGVPGTVRLLALAHREGGRLPWARLLAPAIALAEQGFPVSLRLHQSIAASARLRADPAARHFYFDAAGQPWPVGHVLRNPALAAVLRRLAAEGVAAFYGGPVAQAVVARVAAHPSRPGAMALADLAGYEARERAALCTEWRQWRVCGMPPPSSGHLTLMQILAMVDEQPADPAPEAWAHHWLEAAKLAYADRALYLGDPDRVAAPGGRWDRLLDPAYLRARARLIGPRAAPPASAGRPAWAPVAWAPQADQPEHGTSHLSVVDAQGQAVALTTTIEAGFGNGMLCDGGTGLPGGFQLNNELTDFALQPTDEDGRPVANRVEPGKRPRSSMSPTLVFDRQSGQLLASLGSPGGAGIIHFVGQTLWTLAEGGSPQAAANAPHLLNFNTPQSWLERGRWPAALQDALRARGHRLVEDEMPSGTQVLQRDGDGWRGAADARREGVVRGD